MTKKVFSSYKIGIVGIGLIGGSVARALTNKVGVGYICAVDSDEASLKKAMSDGSITKYSTRLVDLHDCDLIYLCVPAGNIFSIIDEISKWYDGIVTDVTSTKEKILSYVNSNHPKMRFIGGHPMTGSEKVGYAASNENLFENAPYILCSKISKNYSNDEQFCKDLDFVKSLALQMDSVPIEMNPKEHDIAVGLISHLPHIVAYSLVNSVRSRNDERLRSIAAGGFRDITRIASSDPKLWTDILCDSGETIAQLLEEYISNLTYMKNALINQDRNALHTLFSNAKEYRDQLPQTQSLSNRPVQLWVEVDDKPGMIGKIAVLFGDVGINIKNMNIQDNRAYEGGSLRITLSSMKDAIEGARILENEMLQVRIIE